jgi:tRNA dimethylallyltransferase
MVERGAVEEVASYLSWGDAHAPVTHALGFKALAEYSRGKLADEQAIAKAQQLTRNYAKRQCTWFRNRARRLGHHKILTYIDKNQGFTGF